MAKPLQRPPLALDFGDREYIFKLTIKTVGTLQAVRREHVGSEHAGIGAIYRRVVLGSFYFEDLIETIRYALIGGGLSLTDANKLMTSYGDYYSYDELQDIAMKTLSYAMHREKVDDVDGGEVSGKKPEAQTDGLTHQKLAQPPS